MQAESVDRELLQRFEKELGGRVPRLSDGGQKTVSNATRLADVTRVLEDCARTSYGMSPEWDGARVFAKLDSEIFGGSVKVRPAIAIIEEAIRSGRLVRGQTIFEATSGNFGLALGKVGDLGLRVVVLVSRRLQEGVHEQLRRAGVKLIDLDIDICPAPGFKGDADVLVAKGVLAGVKQQLAGIGLDPKAVEALEPQALELLAAQDAIGFAQLLARAYGGFCTQQYENSLNAGVHEAVTGPEIDQQLREQGLGLGDAELVCTFGTGGTATGISRYAANRFGKKVVRVVFPSQGQDVAGIRTKQKASGLKFYQPSQYLGEHEVDFEQAKPLLNYFNGNGYDVGESGALALYACLQLLNYGGSRKLVAMVADGSSKYSREPAKGAAEMPEQTTAKQAAESISEYAGVLWTHGMMVPREEGVSAIAEALGCKKDAIGVAEPADVQAISYGREPSKKFGEMLPRDGKPVLLVCMAGNTSLTVARALRKRGVTAVSLMGGITSLGEAKRRLPSELVRIY